MGFEYIHPFAFLYWAGTLKAEFTVFLKRWLTHALCGLVLYSDGVCPSDGLRFDQGREYMAVLWTFKELPAWFQARGAISWFTFAYIPLKILEDGFSTVSRLSRLILQTFFNPHDFNFEMGIHLQGDVEIRATFLCFVQDEKELKMVNNITGASGTKPCCCCMNCMGRCEPSDITVPGLAHVSSSDFTEFVPHTCESFQEMCNNLATVAAGGGVGELKHLQQVYGMKYDAESLHFDPFLVPILKMPFCIFYDWMHCLVASGGTWQYAVNSIILDIKGAGVSLDTLGSWFSLVNGPKQGYTKLRKHFLRDRIVEKAGSHIRAYAAELLSVVACLSWFVSLVLIPAGVLLEQSYLAIDMQFSLEILLGNRWDLSARLDAVLLKIHVRLANLYPSNIKQKMHYTRHLPEMIRRFERIFSCFPGERMHKHSKKIAAFSFNNCTSTMLGYELHRVSEGIKCESSYEPILLPQAVPSSKELVRALSPLVGVRGLHEVEHSQQATTPIGTFTKGDVVAWKVAGQIRVGKANLFVKFTSALVIRFVGHITEYHGRADGLWSTTNVTERWVLVDNLLGNMMWAEYQGSVRVMLPAILDL